MGKQQSNRPTNVIRVSAGIQAALWESTVEQDGRQVVQYSVKVTRSYRDKTTGEWKTTDYFRVNDLPRLIVAAQKAFEFCVLKGDEDDKDDNAVG